MGERYELFVAVLELVRIKALLPYFRGQAGRPEEDRAALARAFIAKVVFDIPTTRALIERLEVDGRLRRLCGWSGGGRLPSEAFSRAFSEFAESEQSCEPSAWDVDRTDDGWLTGGAHLSRVILRGALRHNAERRAATTTAVRLDLRRTTCASPAAPRISSTGLKCGCWTPSSCPPLTVFVQAGACAAGHGFDSAPNGAVGIERTRRLRLSAGRRRGRLAGGQEGRRKRQVASFKLFIFVVRIVVIIS